MFTSDTFGSKVAVLHAYAGEGSIEPIRIYFGADMQRVTLQKVLVASKTSFSQEIYSEVLFISVGLWA